MLPACADLRVTVSEKGLWLTADLTTILRSHSFLWRGSLHSRETSTLFGIRCWEEHGARERAVRVFFVARVTASLAKSALTAQAGRAMGVRRYRS
jgi:hypothetical protein